MSTSSPSFSLENHGLSIIEHLAAATIIAASLNTRMPFGGDFATYISAILVWLTHPSFRPKRR
ncbi:hypothetical protein JAAARDRAFT_60859 [Jaapia argillacea MUCL 33604]|uniref:Uncharacterized protein n=1 Tax=Jaapia argillacea MUCL 33604 TaxID=933084 RepID=A0A067PRZ8_9AGAM|nr:hypothetical protein JAAARDRAFT_60859 [Jaapia argillacea MUCL 33604]